MVNESIEFRVWSMERRAGGLEDRKLEA